MGAWFFIILFLFGGGISLCVGFTGGDLWYGIGGAVSVLFGVVGVIAELSEKKVLPNEVYREFSSPKDNIKEPMIAPTPPKPTTIEDFLDIVFSDGVYIARIKPEDNIQHISFAGFGGAKEEVFFKDRVVVNVTSNDGYRYQFLAPEDGLLKKYGVFDFLGQVSEVNSDGPLFEFNTNKDAITDFRHRKSNDRREKEIENERRNIANKLKERERRRQLEKQIKQELIEKGEIMPTAGRAPIPRDIVDAVYSRDGGRCVYCGSMENLQIDHIIPHSKGGADSIENFQILCQKCNIEKSNKIG